MSVKKRGLGRGLEALLGSNSTTAGAHLESGGELRTVPVDLIQRGKYQPRVDMHPESLEDLASSIRAQGVVQPIVIRPIGSGRYEIIAGERRWRAAQMAELHDIPAVVREVSDQAAIAMALIENIQREDLNPLEEAVALQRLISEFTLTHQEAAAAVGRSRAAVSNLLRLLELGMQVQEALRSGRIQMGHARALLALTGAQQGEVVRHVAERGLSVRETEQLVRRTLAAPITAPVRAPLDPNVRDLQERLAQQLGAKVEVQARAPGRGALVIHYDSLDQLDGILARIT